MYKLLSVQQIRELEQVALDEYAVTAAELMHLAGREVALAAREMAQDSAGNITILAGPGNNGGDGWAAALTLKSKGVRVRVLSVVDPSELLGPAGEVALEATSNGVLWSLIAPEVTSAEVLEMLVGSDVVVDALLGIGARIPLDERMATLCDALNMCSQPILSVDVPTGVQADTGEIDEHTVRASRTVTFLAAKRGLALPPAFAYTGAVAVALLGIREEDQERFDNPPQLYADDELACQIPLPTLDANKYTRGRVLVIAGSKQYPGAAILAVRGATRCGAGYVTLACPESLVGLMQGHLVTAPVVGVAETREGGLSEKALPLLLELASMADSVLIGPGLDRSEKTAQLVRSFVAQVSDVHIVLDADALNAFVGHTQELLDNHNSLIITPHAGELARLLGQDSASVAQDPLEAAQHFVGDRHTVVLKGPSTVIACQKVRSIDMFGPPVLATAGTGDVLAGMIVALCAQGLDPYRAACLAVRLHGHAALAALEMLTPLCVTSEDVAECIPAGARGLMSDDGGEE